MGLDQSVAWEGTVGIASLLVNFNCNNLFY